ncbi:MAG: TetR/AcrR family transcriptional regulator [Persicimonas sp.]
MTDESRTTRDRLMDAAQELILQHGFSATTVAMIVEHAGVTKGSFFYYFDTKTDLAHALIERYSKWELGLLEETMGRAEKLSRDPRQQLLIFIGLIIEGFGPDGHPPEGCLFASYCYEVDLFDEQTLEVSRQTMIVWREKLREKFEEIVETHPPRLEIDLDSLADMVMTTFEGGFVVARVMREPAVLREQFVHLRNYFELLFAVGD